MSHPVPQDLKYRSANARWKNRGPYRTAFSLTVAFALHGAIFLTWRASGVTNPIVDTPMSSVEVVQLDRSAQVGERTGGTAVPIPAAPVPVPAEPEAEEPGEGESDEGLEGTGEDSRLEIAGSSKALFDRLRDRAPRPTVAESRPERELVNTEESATSDDVTADGTDPSTARALESSMNLSAVDLERLSAVRPKVVLTAPSGWVLVRNRSEVRRFVDWAYQRGRVDREARGTVSVALWIDEDGSVDWAEITDSSGSDDLDRVALELFEEVVSFMPARDEGTPVGTSAIFTVVFPWR